MVAYKVAFPPPILSDSGPTEKVINEQGHRYNLTCNRKMTKETRKVMHLLHMMDLKVFAPNDEKLGDQLEHVKQYSEDIQMEFGLAKCAKFTSVQEKTTTSNISFDQSATKQE